MTPLYPLKAYESVNLKNFADSLIVPSLDSSHLFGEVRGNKSLLKMSPFLSLSQLEDLQTVWTRRIGKWLFNLSLSRRATNPLELPLQVVARLLRSAV